MTINFSESGHPVFHGSSALERGALQSNGKGKLSIHFCGDDDTAKVVLRTIISVNQFSVYGAVADMCDELAWKISGCSVGTVKPVAPNNPENDCRQRTKRLGPMKRCKETCCTIMDENSQIFQIIFN